jgi:hypothetical protein
VSSIDLRGISRMQCLNKHVFARMIVEHLRGRFERWGFAPTEFDRLAPETVTFITRTVGNLGPEAVLADFGKTYFDFLKRMYGNNLGRKTSIQPLTYACLDFAGSRSGSCFGAELPHIHALMLAHPRDTKGIRSLSRVCPLLENAQPYDPATGSLENLATYCVKGLFASGRADSARSHLWDVYPKIVPTRSR